MEIGLAQTEIPQSEVMEVSPVEVEPKEKDKVVTVVDGVQIDAKKSYLQAATSPPPTTPPSLSQAHTQAHIAVNEKGRKPSAHLSFFHK